VSRSKPIVLIFCSLIAIAIATSIVYFTRDSENSELRSAQEAISRRDFQQAGEHLNNYLLTHPDDKAVRLLAAQAARRRGDFTAALSHLTKCQQLNGSNETVELEFRLLRVQQGKMTETGELISTYDNMREAAETPLVMEAIAIGVLKAISPNETASSFLTDAALPLLRAARQASDLWLTLRPDRVDQVVGLVWRGRIRAMEGEQAGGVGDLRKALELDPDNFSVRFHLASLIAQVDPAEAASHLAKLRNQSPNDSQVAFRLATAYRGLGHLDEAERVLDEMLSLNPNEVSVLVERGLVAMDRFQLFEAERFLFRAVKLAPNVPEVNLALSQFMQLRGETSKVKEYRDKFDRLEAAKKR
jgi:Flp pilus assembly protein TadD